MKLFNTAKILSIHSSVAVASTNAAKYHEQRVMKVREEHAHLLNRAQVKYINRKAYGN